MQVLVDVKRRINLDFDCNCKLLFGVGVAKDFRIRFFSIYLRIEEKKKNHVVILICKHVFLIEIILSDLTQQNFEFQNTMKNGKQNGLMCDNKFWWNQILHKSAHVPCLNGTFHCILKEKICQHSLLAYD